MKYQLIIYWKSGSVEMAEHGRHFTRAEAWDYIDGTIDPSQKEEIRSIIWKPVQGGNK